MPSLTLRLILLAWSASLLVGVAAGQTPTDASLPDTQPLTLSEPLDVVMVRGINQCAEHLLATAPEHRDRYWQRDASSADAYLESVRPQRSRLRELLGATEPLADVRLLSDGMTVGTNAGPQVIAVSWPVIEGVSGEGYLLTPAAVATANGDASQRVTNDPPLRTAVIAIPDATQSPEAIIGLDDTLPADSQWARRLAERGCLVLVVAPISRDTTLSGHPDIRFTNMSHRELVYRCGFELGRHLIGYEVQTVSAARRMLEDYLRQRAATVDETRQPALVAVAGVGDGGMLALYAGAVDPEFDAVLVSGYFDEREGLWREPIDRNVWNRVREFGDADLASLVAPRPLLIEAAVPPLVDGPQPPRDGQLPYAAPGRVSTPGFESVRREFGRAQELYSRLQAGGSIALISQAAGSAPVTDSAITKFLSQLGIDDAPGHRQRVIIDKRVDTAAINAARQQRLVGELVRHTQATLHRSDKVRERFWSSADRSSVEAWERSAREYRDRIHHQMIGRLPLPNAPLNARSRKVIDEPTHVGYEVVLDVYAGGPASRSARESGALATQLSTLESPVIAGGMLLLPKDLRPGERRPVVVCQHGLEGTPMDTITTDQSSRAWQAYKGFSTQLVERGFIVYAPQNPYRGEDEFRGIQRKSNPMGLSLFSYIIEQHRQSLRWLATLPSVDPQRIAFYGLSYGGKTAVRVPPLLTGSVSGPATVGSLASGEPGYCLSICSADFNEWIRKNASAEDRYSYVFTKEYEMYEWNMGHLAGYAELASLMARGRSWSNVVMTTVSLPTSGSAGEFAKVRRHYDKLGVGDRCEIEWFNGPHTINGQGTFRCLHKHLEWPEPPVPSEAAAAAPGQ
ncbi:MAG: hypothetical protein R3B90_11695 [Planctomycetaceae bacterium]